MRRQLEENGYVERECGRGPGGKVRLGRSWYRHHLDEPDRDHFAEAVAGVRCPVLIAHGDADDSVPPSHADLIATMFREHNPGVTPKVAMIPGGEHNFGVSGYRPGPGSADNPIARRLYDALLAFLDSGPL